jgi:hypothetical protein
MEEKILILDQVVRDRKAYQFLSDDWRADLDVARASIGKHGITLAFAPVLFKKDRDIALLAVKANGLAIDFVHPELVASDVDLCVAAVNQKSESIEFMPIAMRMNQAVLIALLGCKIFGYGLFKKYVPDALLRNAAFMLRAVSLNGRLLKLASSHVYSLPQVACAAARSVGRLAFKHLEECFEIPEVMEVLESMQAECEKKMDEYLLEADPKKKESLYWEVIQYESDFGIKSVRSERYASTPNLKHEPILETEEEGIRVYFMNDDVAMSHLADDFGNDPMKIDAVFHSANTGLGGFSYALAQQLKEKLHLHATLVMIPLIDRTSSVSICQQAKGIMTEILEECKRNNWHRIRLTNFTYLKSSQFETFLGIGQVLTEQEDQHALTIYLDIDPDFVKGKYGDELNFLGPCKS